MKAICTPNPCIKLFGKVLVFACLLLFFGRAAATIRYVSANSTGSGTSWSDASGNLVAMINASSSGDQVWVTAGDYLNTPTFGMRDGVKIYGGFAGFETDPAQRDLSVNPTTLYSNGGATIIQNNGLTATALLDGFFLTGSTNSAVSNTNSSPTFANCTFYSNSGNSDGGAMLNYFYSSPTLTNCSFQYNQGRSGAAVYNHTYSSPTLINCSFDNNRANGHGGGISNEDHSFASISNCTFTNNTASTNGGGIWNYNYASPTLIGCTFTGNTAGTFGGGIFNYSASSPSITNCGFTGNTGSDGGCMYNAVSSTPSFTNCSFNNNYGNHGGAMYNNNVSPIFTNCIISGNTAQNGGGGVYCYRSSAVFNNCLISGNTTNAYGGGIYNDGSSPQFTNCTIAGNYANSGGSGMYNINSSAPAIRNSIIYNNNSGILNSSSTPTIKYSLVQGLTGTTNGNISGTSDPLFVNPISPGLDAGGDYSLQPCSPVIDKGSNTYYASGKSPDLSAITTDLAGNARFYNSGTIDIGAYEKQGVTVTAAGAAGILYVKSGGTGTGSSWSCATGDLQAAINAAVSGNQIWVAGGTYIPNCRADATATITTGDRNNAFVLKSGVKIYGGFAGTETSLLSRNLSITSNASILSGDFNGDDNGINNNSENAYHVVVSAGDVSTAELNGFTIQGGNCNGSVAITVNGQGVGTNGGGAINCSNSSPTLSHLIIKSNAGRYGAGLCFSSSSPTISNSIISGNAGFYGGAIIASNSGAILTNVLISGNTAVEQGGGMYNEFAVAPTLTNVTITGNTANYNSGAMYNNLGPSINIRNCIIYGNNTGINNNNGTPSIQYSLVQGETSTANGNISGATDPLFVNPQTAGLSTGGDYSLQACSPAVNAGNNIVYGSGQSPDLSAITIDLNSTTRKQGTSVDMGVYEFAGSYNGNPGTTDLLAINGDADTVANVSGTTMFTASGASCRLISNVLPGGTRPIYGHVTATVWIESTQPSTYVRRHYEITGWNTVPNTTGRATLYFTQADFDAYNAVNALQLPTSSTDAMGKARLIIEQYYGKSADGTGLPASYYQTPTLIDPYNSNIVWNSTLGRWEVTFDDVTGFGGFLVTTQATPLPLTLLSFTGNRYNEYNQLQWKTADEVNTENFVLERSSDGRNFVAIATIAANGVGNGSYSYKDYTSFSGKIYYRLKMVDVDGHYTYSTMVTLLNNGNNAVSIYPNPASDVVYINAGTDLLYSQAGLYDANGRLLQTIVITAIPQAINVQQLTKGLYVLKFANGATEKFIKK